MDMKFYLKDGSGFREVTEEEFTRYDKMMAEIRSAAAHTRVGGEASPWSTNRPLKAIRSTRLERFTRPNPVRRGNS